jgi:hypothetical protein
MYIYLGISADFYDSVVIHEEGKFGRFLITLIVTLDEAELLCNVVSETAGSIIIPP